MSTDLFEREVKEAFLQMAQATAGCDNLVSTSASLLHAAANAGVAGLSRETFLRHAAAQFDRVAGLLDSETPSGLAAA